VTTEDPANGFKPDFGTLIAYRNAAGFGIRLDEGSAYPGMKISPFFDSMIVKVTARGRTLKGASQRLARTLVEYRIRGVKTNIPFLRNVINHPEFQQGKARVSFIENHPELLDLFKPKDRSTKAMRLIADVIVNGNRTLGKIDKIDYPQPKVPLIEPFQEYPDGNKQRLDSMGAEKFAQWVKDQKQVLFTDTTFRDGHQSLLATRVRTQDMLAVAEGFAKDFPQLFSMEVWGGATFDVAMRFLYESPWRRLQSFREAMPNMLLQMLLRGSNAVGYTAYPDNLVESFIEKSAENGIDVFRIFDSLNWIESMKLSIRTVRERTNSLAEAAICYTGDMMDPNQTKYTLEYYLDMARQLEDEGAHIIAIKDMAGLLKPNAAEVLVRELKKAVDLPVHLHTHDTSSIQAATYLKSVDSGIDVIDCALGGLSGLTSQPNFNSVAAMLKGHERECELDLPRLNQYSNYWEDVRAMYATFESGLKSGSAEVYEHEMPGGQYSNLKSQAISLGLGDKFDDLKHNYHVVNKMFGDIVKVTPSSKVVGDMALFMTSNDLNEEDIFKKGDTISFPESVKGFFRGDLGQPPGGFPKELQKIILKDIEPYTERPNAHMEPIDLEADFKQFEKDFPGSDGYLDFLAFKLYDKVYEEFHENRAKFGDVSIIPSQAFWYGLHPNEEILIKIEEGKTILVRYLHMSEPDEEGKRSVSFELNGQTRRINVRDRSMKVVKPTNKKVSKEGDIGAPLQGRISRILVNKGDEVQKNTHLYIIEAMKMESIVAAPFAGVIASVQLNEGTVVEQNDWVVEIDKA
jgi:pyruvate carboxylase